MSEIITVITRDETTYEVDTSEEKCIRHGVSPKQKFIDKKRYLTGEIIGISASRVDPGGCAKEKFITFVKLDKDGGLASFYVGRNPEEMGIALL